MVDIELVVKITEEAYMAFKSGDGVDWVGPILSTVDNGTPLPKGHDDLVDRGKILANFVAARDELSHGFEFDDGLHEAWEIVNSEDATPAIIKAEGSNS